MNKNLIKFTLGLPLLIALTVGGFICYIADIVFNSVLNDQIIDDNKTLEDIINLWKPIK